MYHPSRRTNLVPTSMSLIRIYKYYYDIVCVFFVGIEFKVYVKNTSYDVVLTLVWHFCLDFSKYYFGVQLDRSSSIRVQKHHVSDGFGFNRYIDVYIENTTKF